eukprot:SAG31_NODE_489_length_14938_cov_5.644113_9_plen_74_part_00
MLLMFGHLGFVWWSVPLESTRERIAAWPNRYSFCNAINNAHNDASICYRSDRFAEWKCSTPMELHLVSPTLTL